jgi:hypothetical protein
MGRKADARALLFERIRTSPPKFVHVVGVPYFVEREPEADPLKVDHVWITIEAPPFGRLRCSINTLSRLARDLGHDERLRVAIVKSTWTEKPETGLQECTGQDYAKVEKIENVFYEHYERDPLAEMLVERAKRAIRAEVWGDLYAREHLGVHQIHSRRASSAVPTDLKNRDGALKLYYAQDNVAELFLFKFFGQP